ncbi:ATP-binding protein [Actinacidiphila acididurans]|uniref:ATP-binding protein n=1 Tax=Actinacidiphila acididurans TaxID=2784346 RepID=A0ABS2TLC2_9ACTN|nr:ATP-binding protein [Actinacidiphila acididurans]MBM9504138.1 ATP-binding protein [Actinacidiphila acididurans]
MQVSGVYQGEGADIAAARRLVEELFARLGSVGTRVAAAVAVNVKLVVSELATNAVKCTAGPFGVDLRVIAGAVEITVWDTSTQVVTAMAADPLRVGSHGMEIVKVLCGGFTTTPTVTGKRITARMPLRSAAA